MRGVIFQVDSLAWKSDDLCVVDGGYFFDGMGAGGNWYEVGLRDGRWTVLKAMNTWIS